MDSDQLRDEEYGGFLLMMDTVPEKSDYDYGMNYIRIVSTYIPRIVWPTKPLFGRDQWVGAWIAGSEMERDEEFTGPAIGILGATQLNGGAFGTLDRAGRARPGPPHGLRVLPAPRGFTLGPVLVGDHVLQRLVHGGRRRSPRPGFITTGASRDFPSWCSCGGSSS